MVLRQLHPEGEDIPPTDIVALFQAGQVDFMLSAPLAQYGPLSFWHALCFLMLVVQGCAV